jgi:hypothetical protein
LRMYLECRNQAGRSPHMPALADSDAPV